MTKILVSGLINLETTLRVDRFPLEYEPVRYPFYGVQSKVSGVGLNIAKALHGLGDEASLLSLIGRDPAGGLVPQALEEAHLSGDYVLPRLEQTAASVILYEPGGRRQIHTDLKDIQDQAYPSDLFERALAGCDLAVLCNINFSRPMLERAMQAGVPIATDVHAIASLDDEYNQDFMEHAEILFMSHERLPAAPETWARRVLDRFRVEALVIGLGEQGALLAVGRDRFIGRFPAVRTRQVVNTIGAGDALFSCFVHRYLQSGDAYEALRAAVVFASYKVGSASAADGFLDPAGLERWLAAA